MVDAVARAVGQDASSASGHHKVEALRMYLEQSIGLSKLVAAHRVMEKRSSAGASAADIDEQVLSIVGDDNARVLPVLRQLVEAERQLASPVRR